MKFLQRALQKTGKLIRKRKGLVALLVLGQLVFISLLILVTLTYQIRIFSNIQGIVEPLQNANYDAEQISEGIPFSGDMLTVFQNYRLLKENIQSLLLWIAATFVFFNGLLWIGSHKLFGKLGFRGAHKLLAKFLASAGLVIVPLIGLVWFVSENFLTLQGSAESLTRNSRLVGFGFGFLYYLMLVSFAFIPTKSWKGFVKKVRSVGVRKIYLAVLPLAVSGLLMGGAGYLVYLATIKEGSLFFLLGSGLLFGVAVVWSRIFWIASLQELSGTSGVQK